MTFAMILKIVKWLLRLLAGGGFLFALQHEARAADQLGVGVNTVVNLLVWLGGAVGMWFTTTGTFWEKLRFLLDWINNNPPPFQERVDKAVAGYQAFAQCCGECGHIDATERDAALEASGKVLAKMLAHAHKHNGKH